MTIKVNLLLILRRKKVSINCHFICQQFTSQHSRIANAKIEIDKVMNAMKSSISGGYKAQVDCWEDSEFDYYNKHDMKEKANDLVKLEKTTHEKL